MPLYPLGIIRSRDMPSALEQASGSFDVRWSLEGNLACGFIDAPRDPPRPTLHADALDALHRRICVLPVRFGLVVREEAEIRSLLQNRRREWLDRLDCLEGTCEMGLRFASPSKSEVAVPAKPPSAYLEDRRTHYRRADENAERDRSMTRQIVERLQGCCRQWRELPSSPLYSLRLAFLVERDRVAAFQSRLENICDKHQERRCAILGPWPPYSFV
jgi:hypothetical protein